MEKKKRYKIFEYPAVFSPAEEGGYDVSFPDFPGCVTFGRSFEEAKEKASEILELWLDELKASRQIFPMRTQRPIIDDVAVSLRS